MKKPAERAARKREAGLASPSENRAAERRIQERVRAMDDELAIDSKPGSGTVVTVSVPLSEDREQCAAQS
jgi:hypothetical protein